MLMKSNSLIACLFLVGIVNSLSAQHKLTQLWETEATLPQPESVLAEKDVLYVSLINGEPWKVDGKGGIAKVGKDGKIQNLNWVKGLNAPKGMGIWNNDLYVADISNVVVIDVATGKVKSKIAIPGAKGLNDITIDNAGVIYVTDTQLGNVHRIQGKKISVYVKGLKSPNGLKALGKDLYILTSNGILRVGGDMVQKPLGKLDLPGDGIEPIGKGDFIVTCTNGLIYYLNRSSDLELLLDSRGDKINAADIGIDGAQRIIYVPTLMNKSVVAYKVSGFN